VHSVAEEPLITHRDRVDVATIGHVDAYPGCGGVVEFMRMEEATTRYTLSGQTKEL